MATGLNVDINHTYEGQELSEILLKPVFASPEIMKDFRVIDGITSKANLYLASKMAKLIKKSEGCTRNEKGEIEFSDRVVEVEELDVQNGFCKDVLSGTFLEESLKKGSNAYDLTGTDVLNAVMAQMAVGLVNDVRRVFWFAKDGASSGDYDMFDGFWALVLADATVVVEDTTDYETTGVLDADAAIDILNNMIEKQPAVLRALPRTDKKFRVSPSFIDNFRRSLTSGAFDSAQQLLQNGIPTYYFDGIELVEETAWTENLADADNPVATDLGANIALLTVRDNLIIGCDTVSAGKDFSIWYEKKDRKVLTDGVFKLGVQYLHSELMVVAYGSNDSN